MSTSNPTVLYDEEGGSPSLLAPPDLPQLLRSKKKGYRWHRFEIPRSVQIPITCLSITMSALQANGAMVWPTYGPVVAQQLELTGPQAQTIALGGSLVSALVSGIGYSTFVSILKTEQPGTPYIHLYLAAAFFLVGGSIVGLYFACLTCSSLSFPSKPTLALSIPLSLVGLSSLFLSSFSTLPFFLNKATPPELDAEKYMTFLGIAAVSVNLFGFIFMRVIPPIPASKIDIDEARVPKSPIGRLLHLDEHTPLLIGGPEAAREEAEAKEEGKAEGWSVRRMVGDWEFWVFGALLSLSVGPVGSPAPVYLVALLLIAHYQLETMFASIGAILTSLLPPSTPILSAFLFASSPTPNTPKSALSLRNKHVLILSLSSTIFRLFTGILADYLSPPATALPPPPISSSSSSSSCDGSEDGHMMSSTIFIQTKPIRLHRSAYAGICCGILGMIFAWNAEFLKSEKGLWVLSGGVGAMYGSIFTLMPAIVSAHFGPTNFGLAWGMISYFSAGGSVIFAYLYALISDSMAKHSNTCYGSKCFIPTFWIATATCLVSGLGIFLLGKRWKL
ncbi:hypothetical protein P7C73_g1872, partial [Tremellales sp. Uapishka_1]